MNFDIEYEQHKYLILGKKKLYTTLICTSNTNYNRLSELVTRWTDKYVLDQIEHYQNEFILHGGVIEDMLEEIEKHETRIAEQSKIDEYAIDTQLAKKHIEFRNCIET